MPVLLHALFQRLNLVLSGFDKGGNIEFACCREGGIGGLRGYSTDSLRLLAFSRS